MVINSGRYTHDIYHTIFPGNPALPGGPGGPEGPSAPGRP